MKESAPYIPNKLVSSVALRNLLEQPHSVKENVNHLYNSLWSISPQRKQAISVDKLTGLVLMYHKTNRSGGCISNRCWNCFLLWLPGITGVNKVEQQYYSAFLSCHYCCCVRKIPSDKAWDFNPALCSYLSPTAVLFSSPLTQPAIKTLKWVQAYLGMQNPSAKRALTHLRRTERKEHHSFEWVWCLSSTANKLRPVHAFMYPLHP